jgi:HNH endonuclease
MGRQELECLVKEYHSIRRIAEAARVSPTTVRYWLRIWGMKSDGDQLRKTELTKTLCRNCGNPVRQRPNIYCSISCQYRFRRRMSIEDGTAGKRALRSHLLDSRERRCEICKLAEWMDKPIPLEVDHIDGDSTNIRLDNIRLICPNCHAQTETYKVKNKGHGRYYRRERYAQGKSY